MKGIAVSINDETTATIEKSRHEAEFGTVEAIPRSAGLDLFLRERKDKTEFDWPLILESNRMDYEARAAKLHDGPLTYQWDTNEPTSLPIANVVAPKTVQESVREPVDPPGICEEAAAIVRDRQKNYGKPFQNHKNFIGLFCEYFRDRKPGEFTVEDVPIINILQKLGRLKTGGYHRDTVIDIAGYADNLGEIAVERGKRRNGI